LIISNAQFPYNDYETVESIDNLKRNKKGFKGRKQSVKFSLLKVPKNKFNSQ